MACEYVTMWLAVRHTSTIPLVQAKAGNESCHSSEAVPGCPTQGSETCLYREPEQAELY